MLHLKGFCLIVEPFSVTNQEEWTYAAICRITPGRDPYEKAYDRNMTLVASCVSKNEQTAIETAYGKYLERTKNR